MRHWIALLCVGLVAGCQESSEPSPRGLLGPDGQPIVRPPTETKPSSPPPTTRDAPAFQKLDTPFGSEAPPAPEHEPTTQKAPPPMRDLSVELARLIPSPSECLDLAQAARSGQVSITVRAQVAASGRLSRLAVSIPGQRPEATRCVERRMSQAVLAPDVPGAPLQVEANLSVEVIAQPPPAAPLEPPKTTLPTMQPNVAQPENGEVAQPDGTDFAQPSQ